MSLLRRTVMEAHLVACAEGVASFVLGFDKEALLAGRVVASCMAGQTDIPKPLAVAFLRAMAASIEGGEAPERDLWVHLEAAPFDDEDQAWREHLRRLHSAPES